MERNSIKKALGARKLRKLLGGNYDYEGEILEKLVSKLCPLLDRVGYEGLEKVAGVCSQVAVSLLEESPELIERLLKCGEGDKDGGKELVAKVYGLCSQVAREVGEAGEVGKEGKVGKVGKVGEAGEGTAIRLLERSPELLDRVGYEGLEKVASLCSRVAREDSFVAARLVGLSPELLDRVGYEGLEKVAGLCSRVGKDGEGRGRGRERRFVAALLERSPELLDRVGYEGLERVAGLCGEVAGFSGGTAVKLLAWSPELVGREGVGYEGLEEVVGLCSRVAREDSFVAARLLEMSPALVGRVGCESLERLAELCCEVNKDDGFVAARLLEESPALVARLLKCGEVKEEEQGGGGKELVASVYWLCSQVAVAGKSWRTAVRLLGQSPELVERLRRLGGGGKGGKELVLKVYGLCSRVAGSSGSSGSSGTRGSGCWRTAVSLLEASPDLICRAGYEGLEKVACKASEIAQAEAVAEGGNEEKAVSFVRGELSEYADFFDSITVGLELRKVKPVLLHYLNALLGYRLEIAEAEQAGQGAAASTDGERIFLPGRVKDFGREEEKNFVLYKVLATHEEAHLEYGSFDFELVRVQEVVRKIQAKYGERRRAKINGTSDLEEFYALFPEPALARDLTTVLEDYRIKLRLQAEYPVLGEQIAEMNAHLLSKRTSLGELANDKQRAVEVVAQRLIAGTTKDPVPEEIEETLDRALSVAQTLSSPQADVHETARVAAELYFLINESFQGLYHNQTEQPLQPFSAPLDQAQVTQNIGNFGRTARKISAKLASNEPNNNEPNKSEEKKSSKEAVKKLLKALFKEKGVKPREVESRIEALEPSEVADYFSELETLIRTEKGNGLRRERGTFLYHEWGSDIKDYRLNWARVKERTLEGGSDEDEFYLETVQKYAGLIKVVRREFQMLRPEGLVKLRGQFDGDEIDLDAAVQYFIDKRLRLSPSERNYIRTEKRTREIAVAFLVDVSGSTVGATIECEKEALILMSEALEELGDAFAIFGFSGHGRENVVFYKIKDFEESYDQRVRRRISAMTNEQATRIAPAVRHTTTKLRQREEKTRILVLLSDGKPLDRDYHGSYAIEDTRMALKEAERFGVRSFCVTVDREAAEYLPRMYGSSRWVVIDEVAKLPEKITRIYKRFTT